jgi:Flp pilus assembly protein TadD
LRDAVATDPGNHSLRVSLADLLADAGLAAEAEPEYQRVLESRPNDVAALLGLGLLLARTDRFEPAVAALTRVLEIDPGQDEARFERAVVYERLGRSAEARAGYERLDAPATRPDIRKAAEARLARLPR